MLKYLTSALFIVLKYYMDNPNHINLTPANATTTNSNFTNVSSFILNMIGLAQKTPITEINPNPQASGIIDIPKAPDANLMGILPTFKKQKNMALVPIYSVGDNFRTDSRYTFSIGPIEFVNIVAAPPNIPTTKAHPYFSILDILCCC